MEEYQTIRKHGDWRTVMDNATQMYECPHCLGRMFTKEYDIAVGTWGYRYCPYCGKKNKGDVE